MALNLELNTERYIKLMEKLIGETEFLQNNPPRHVPQEDRYTGRGSTTLWASHHPATHPVLPVACHVLLFSLYNSICPFPLVSLRAVKHVLDALKPYLVENGGVIKADHVTFVEGRGNLMLEYCPEGASGVCGLHVTMTSYVPTQPHMYILLILLYTQKAVLAHTDL